MSVVLDFKSHLSEQLAKVSREVVPNAVETEILIECPKLAAHGD